MAKKKLGVVQKIKKTKAVSRWRAKRRGRKKLSETQLEKISTGILKQQVKTVSRQIFESKKASVNLNELRAVQKEKGLALISRSATKYALDAIGLSPRHDAKTRKQVHEIMREVNKRAERDAKIMGQTGHRPFEWGLEKLIKLLGEEQAKQFFIHWNAKIGEIGEAAEKKWAVSPK